MQVVKNRLKWSLIGLVVVPYMFLIIAGVVVVTTSLISYNDVFVIFLCLVLLGTLLTLYNYMAFRKLKKKCESIEIVESSECDEGVKEIENVIGKNTQFIGDIQTSNDVLVLGSVDGSIKTTADVFVEGLIEGHITCGNLIMSDAVVNGDIDCYKTVNVDALSIVRGNVHTDVLIHDGKIKGNIDIEGHMELSKNCVILGDILAREIELPHGAQIHGNLNIKK